MSDVWQTAYERLQAGASYSLAVAIAHRVGIEHDLEKLRNQRLTARTRRDRRSLSEEIRGYRIFQRRISAAIEFRTKRLNKLIAAERERQLAEYPPNRREEASALLNERDQAIQPTRYAPLKHLPEVIDAISRAHKLEQRLSVTPIGPKRNEIRIQLASANEEIDFFKAEIDVKMAEAVSDLDRRLKALRSNS